MTRWTLREAALRTSRSVTTLRRYIRSGRLNAEKSPGRFGPEYFVTQEDLQAAGLVAIAEPEAPLVPSPKEPTALTREPREPLATVEAVPISLYQELQMKHEQLLVQYGMVRAGGLRVMKLQAELDAEREAHEASRAQIQRIEREWEVEAAELRRQLRRARVELETRQLEVRELREKLRSLEISSRNAARNLPIDEQLLRLQDQKERVRALRRRDPGRPRPDFESEV